MTGMRAIVVLAAVALTTACASGSSSTGRTAAGSGSAAPSSLSGRDIGLQLRPVVEAHASSAGECGTAGSPSPSSDAAATSAPVTACSTDGSIVYSLGPAAITGERWQSLTVDDSRPSAAIDAVLDPLGATALTKITADLATNDQPQNQLAFYADGLVLMAPTVTQPIYGGQTVIAGYWTAAEARALVDRLTG